MKPRALILTGYGINCDEETCRAFRRAGAEARIVHVNELVEGREKLSQWQILTFTGGFSYGDETGSGKALANRLRNNLSGELKEFVKGDRLVLGICNGFQVMACLGLLPFPEEGSQKVALTHNRSARYVCRWVDLKVEDTTCVFTRGLSALRMPVAHGEGRFTTSKETYEQLHFGRRVVVRYAFSNGERARGKDPANPNGSLEDVAGICDRSGRVFGLMPHPERSFLFLQRDNWPEEAGMARGSRRKLPEFSDGYFLFRNAVEYFE